MNARSLLAITFSLLISKFSYSEVREKHVDFTLSPAIINEGKIQIAFEWLSPNEFIKRDLSVMDVPKMSALHPNNNHMIISKIAFISSSSFDELSYNKMNNARYISNMLNSVGIDKLGSDFWNVTNQVKAYAIPFKVNFDFKFREVSGPSLGTKLHNYLNDEASAFKQNGRVRILALDMTNFSQLMYRNYSVVYMKELDNNKTLIISGVISSFNINKANSFFEYPPFSTSKNTMMKNLRKQTLHMANSIRK